MFNIILQDGTRSDNPFISWVGWDGKLHDRYDYFLPQDKKITKVIIYYLDKILGFRFHLSDGSTWCIGEIGFDNVTVKIADNEVIVGFKAKSHPESPAWYVKW